MLNSALVQAGGKEYRENLAMKKKTLPKGESRPKGDLGLRGDRSKPLIASLVNIEFWYLISLNNRSGHLDSRIP